MSELITSAFSEGVFKLHEDGGIMGRVLKDAHMKTNAGKMSATVVLTTTDEDRSGDIVIPKGIDLSDHRKNPIALLNHDRNAPIGRFEDKLGQYTVKMRGDNQLVGEVFFNQSSEFAHDVFRAVENKIFTGVSIGFMPKRVEKRNSRGIVYHQSALVEGSILTIGDNPNAIVEAVNKSLSGGKSYGPELIAMLKPLCPSTPEIVTSGWDADAIAKGGTYKTAEAKEVEPQYRSSVYYTCPHCGEGMPPESIYKEEDGKTRHGPCRGEIRMKATTDGGTGSPGSTPLIHTGVHPALLSEGKSLNLSPSDTVGWRTKMFGDDDTLLGGTGDDMSDPNDPSQMVEQTDPTEEAWLTIAHDLVQQAMAHDETALKKLKILIDTRKKLIDSGDDGDIPDLSGEDNEVEGLEADDDESDSNVSDEGEQGNKEPPKKNKKDKSLMWRPEDAAIITKSFKLLTSILVSPKINRDTLDSYVRETLDEMETIAPIESGIVAKSIRVLHRKPEPEEDLSEIFKFINESDAERDRRCAERDKKLFDIFGR